MENKTVEQIDKECAEFENRLHLVGFKQDEVLEYGQNVTLGLLMLMNEHGISIESAIKKLQKL